MHLTESRLKSLKPKDHRYKMSVDHGLYIEVMPSGKKYWRLQYRVAGKQKQRSLGSFPLIRLAEARDIRDGVRRKLFRGIDPDRHDVDSDKTEQTNLASWRVLCLEFIEKAKKRRKEQTHHCIKHKVTRKNLARAR